MWQFPDEQDYVNKLNKRRRREETLHVSDAEKLDTLQDSSKLVTSELVTSNSDTPTSELSPFVSDLIDRAVKMYKVPLARCRVPL